MSRFALCFLSLLSTLLLTVPLSANSQQSAVPVFVTQIERSTFVDKIQAIGSLQAKENVELTPTVTELVTEVNFDDGQRVKKGDVLVNMDDAEELALLAEEESRVGEAERQVKRLEPLVARNAASRSDLDSQKLQLQTALARVNAIKSRLRQRKIIAPFDGVVGLRNISVGALTQPGVLITTIDFDSVMKLDFAVPELFISVLQQGAKIEAKTSAWPDKTFSGTIASIDSRIDPVTRSIKVRALLDNPDFLLRPGLLMRVELQKNPREAIIIPEEALIIRGNEQSVFVAMEKDGKTFAERKVVTIGSRRKGEVEIIDGLEVGQLIITHGTLRVRPGVEINIEAIQRSDESLAELLQQSGNSNQ